MSFQPRNDRRENITNSNNRSRFSARRDWIPRGAPGLIPTPNLALIPTSAPVNSSSTTFNPNPNGNGGRDLNIRSGPPQPVDRNKQNLGSRAQTSRGGYQRRDREKDVHQEERGLKGAVVPQLVQEIQDKLLKGTVECMICYDMVRRSAPIWSCSSCYSIFHLHCIKKWAGAPTSVDVSAEKNQGFNWRCPGCQSVQLTSSKEIRYVCFCNKRVEPPSDLYLTPHSCGEPCGKQLEKEVPGYGVTQEDLCPHHCVLQCHPGPCPPCKAFAPPTLCPCGKKTITTRCSDRKSVLTCGQRCNKLLDCQRHRCEKICHLGSCDTCQVTIDASCFCKKKSEIVLCGDMTVKGDVNVENGLFSCSQPCEKNLKCGNHVCRETCHPGPCGDCDLLPGRIKTCYCGKTALQEKRYSCLDPIPSCSQFCDKRLPCGLHNCMHRCHEGACAPCSVMVTQKCRCGASSRTVECYKKVMEAETFICDRPCGRKKNCGRHRCSERCCPLSNSNNSHSGDWYPHLCSMPCEKKLRCGQHACESLCHSGHCPTCPETIFNDLTCACGRSSIPPPLPCGTPPPSCHFPCLVPQSCGHSSTHSCHFGDCPPCSVPIAKECIGGHVILRNIPCGSKDIRCNKLCGKTRQCGMHACARACHPPPCDSSCGSSSSGVKASCGQTCGAPRRDCRHTCTALCHPYGTCPDVRCEFPVTITCSCGRITANVPCDAGGNSSGYNADTVFEASMVQKLPAPLQPIEANGKKIPLGQRKLMCDDECSKVERKRVLADAFGVTTPNIDALHLGEDAAASELFGDLLRRDPKWVFSVEERCKWLVLGRSRGGSSGLKVHVFCPMLKEKRDAVRLIAERWKLTVNAKGWEPKRFIVVHVTPKSKAPARMLGVKGPNSTNLIHPPVFDPLLDMDPRFVVALFDLPGDADVSALVLRFGGECELVWLNDKNALAVFSDPARATTAMRRLDHGSVYYGAVVLNRNGSASGVSAWGVGTEVAKDGGSLAPVKGNPWKKAVVQEMMPDHHKESSWGPAPEEWAGMGSSVSNVAASSAWKGKGQPIAAVNNRWSVLDPEVPRGTGLIASLQSEESEKNKGSHLLAGTVEKASSSNVGTQVEEKSEESSDVAEDWEEAYQ